MEVTAIIRFKNSSLYKKRIALGLTQKQIGEAVGVSQSQIYSWESFRQIPRRGNPHISALLSLLDTSYEEIFPEEYRKAVALNKGRKFTADFEIKELPEWVDRNLMLPSPETTYERKEMTELLYGVLLDLPWRECEVLIKHFGLAGTEEQTLDEIAEYLGLSRERVRQIECKAMRKLGHLDIGHPLLLYLDKRGVWSR